MIFGLHCRGSGTNLTDRKQAESLMFDEELPRKKNDGTFPRNLERLSVAELGEYVLELEGEIARVKQDITKKKASQDAASTLFKS